MPRKPSKTIEEEIYEAKMKLMELKEDYATQLYFETMPKVNPLYNYSYQDSNMYIPWEYQSVDAWLRAIIKHMALRIPGHGGQATEALVITMYRQLTANDEAMWIDYITQKLKKHNKKRMPKPVTGKD